eukprot:scaffold366726_cov39-Attheya_sp.AAC.1
MARPMGPRRVALTSTTHKASCFGFHVLSLHKCHRRGHFWGPCGYRNHVNPLLALPENTPA